MKKNVKTILMVLGAIFLFYILRSVWGGFSSTINPGIQVQKAKCLAECREDKLSDDCDQYCIEQTLGK